MLTRRRTLIVGVTLVICQVAGVATVRAGGRPPQQPAPVFGTGFCSQAFVEQAQVQCFPPDQITLVAREAHHIVLDPRLAVHAFSSLPLTQVAIFRFGQLGNPHAPVRPTQVSFLFGHFPYYEGWVMPQETNPKYIEIIEGFGHFNSGPYLDDIAGFWRLLGNTALPNLLVDISSNTSERVVQGIGTALTAPVRGVKPR